MQFFKLLMICALKLRLIILYKKISKIMSNELIIAENNLDRKFAKIKFPKATN